MKILLFGSTGQVGYELQKSLQPLGKLVVLDRNIVNLENTRDIKHCISDHNPDIIVNAAAYTAVDKAESEPKKAFDINASALGPNLKYESIQEWDSIGHMGLIAELEDSFDISMEMDDIIDFSSYKKGFELLSKYEVEF